MLRILLGFLIVIVGYIIVWKADWFLKNVGYVEWAEEHLTEGSYLFYKLIGICVILLGIFFITGIWYDLLNSFLKLLGLEPK
jgi:hypothetical protein